MNIHKTTIFFLLFISVLSCYSQSNYHYHTPNQQEDDWKTASLQEHQIDSALFYRFFSQFDLKKHKIHSFLLFKNGHLVLEEYADNNSLQQAHDIRSATKSITSLLVGIAIDKGFIKSINDPVSQYLGNYKSNKNQDKRKDSITIKHLLTMSPGLECNDWNKKSAGQEDKMYKKRDWIQFVLDLPMSNKPGDTSLYCTGGVVLLGEVLLNATGMRMDEFAKKHLFTPLGINNYQWAYFNNDKQIDSGGHLYLTARSMGKIGQLVLNKGKWNEEQLVSKDWIEMSTTQHTQISQVPYGFLWWRIPFQVNGTPIQSIVATGNGGQYILIFPSLELVAVFTGGNYNSEKDKIPFEIINKVVLPSVMK